MVDLYTLSVLAFFAIIAVLLYRDRKKLEIKYILVMRRTKRFRSIIDSVARVSPKFWKALATLGVLVCFYYMIQGFYLLTLVGYDIFSGKVTQPALQFILPTASAQGSSGPGYVLIPFWFWIITIAAILVPHEFFHGVVSRAEKIPLKSVGLLLLAIFPGAFVEPEEKALKRSKTLTKLRVFAAGSFANFIVAGFFLLFLSHVLWPLSVGSGFYLDSVNETSPAALAGLKPGITLTEFNGKPAQATYNEYISTGGRSYLLEELGSAKPGDSVLLKADGKAYNVTLASQGNRTYVGINYTPSYKLNSAVLFPLSSLLTMIWLLSLAVGVVNILPLYPLDGGLMVEAVAERISKKNSKYITKALSFVTFAILLYTFFGPFIR